MKLILTHEVDNLGHPGDVVEVKDGYGRNYLLPRGDAIRWTRGAEKQIDSIKKARSVREVRDVGEATEIKTALEGSVLRVHVRAGESGRLFGAVSVSDVASALEARGHSVDKRRIQLGNPIRSLGAHQVTVRVHPEVTATVKVDVVAS